MDAGYDYEPIYEQVYRMGHRSIAAYNKRNEGEPIGFEKHFAPTCFREHSYRYDSFDANHETLKYTRSKECNDCPLPNESNLKEFFQLDNVRYRTGKRAKIHFYMVTIIYNSSKLAAERINAQLNQQ